ncbi:Zn-ribbon domain-containing OB-fold protein [Brevibacillus choshinensis]|uniref:Zn-ribbon domain-containing OB-fold protein n=1 Tax=Brevibacillus choshinensis TaxID=54911 RepID=A0ABX7FSP7_BRECH|nr:Zn-ribbon domain-containing OB-fold protein [Brevibacillus choshinensis]QRG68765.1 Zn-ribbon domain-containing OB-fold protein [Brevibacillus choshinensis]
MASQIPKPVVDSDSKPYWDGLNNHELMIQHCDDCSKHIFYPRLLCPHCFSDQISWKQASGQGHIYSYTVVHRAFGPFADQTPYVVAIVELAEGVRMMSRIIGNREDIAIGKPVSVTFERVDDDLTLPYFKLA